jgi:hypothetical protein
VKTSEKNARGRTNGKNWILLKKTTRVFWK